jgi:hypothetical protein
MARYGKKAQSKVKRAMHERKRGTLKSGRSGKTVTSRKQAIAIGLSEARKAAPRCRRRSPRRASREKRAANSQYSKRVLHLPETPMSLLSPDELAKLRSAESLFASPIPVQSVSSDEFMPSPQTAKQREFEARVRQEGARMAKRLGMSRRRSSRPPPEWPRRSWR